MDLNAVNYLRLPMKIDAACSQPTYCTTTLPGWDSSCKTKEPCDSVLVSVEDNSVQEALSQYDKNHDHILGPEDVQDTPMIRDYGIESVDLIPTTTRRIAELFIGQQMLVGKNRFFSSPDDVIRFAWANYQINKTYQDVQWLQTIPLFKPEGGFDTGAFEKFADQASWNAIQERFGETGIRSALLAFNNLENISQLHMIHSYAHLRTERDLAKTDITRGNQYYRIMPWGMPFEAQQDLIDMARKLTAIVKMARDVSTIFCECPDAPDSKKDYALSSTNGVAILYQYDTHGLNALYDTTYGSGTLVTASTPTMWVAREVQGQDGIPNFTSFVSGDFMLSDDEMIPSLAPKQASIF